MHPRELLYETATRLLIPALRVAAPFHDKLRRGVAGRRDSLRSLTAWAASFRDDARPLVWLHAPSVGEALMAQAILEAVRAREPDVQSIFTFFSPSAERVAPRVGADWSGYLPWDTRAAMHTALDAARPSCVAFVRTEIWPVLVREAQARGARVVLVNAVLANASSRTGAGARALLGHAYTCLAAVGAVSTDDADRFALLDVDPARVHVTGDARFDQVWKRIAALDASKGFTKPAIPLLVAGSTWPADEQRLLPVLVSLRGTLRSIVVPHEPTSAHLAVLERRLTAADLTHARLPADANTTLPDADVVVVDRIGVLADLYSIGDIAYVGGGFGTAGLHSVVEPAALGVPAVYGPRHGSAREGRDLDNAGGGFIAADAAALHDVLTRLAVDTAMRRTASSAAREFVHARLGGADRNADLILAR